jgi:hypothetical protein
MGGEKGAYGVLKDNPERMRPLEDIDERIILKCSLEKYDGVVEWIYVTQDKYQWWDAVNTVMNLQVS